MNQRLYVAATNQHVGKTTTTLGLVEALRQKGRRVGYCKPVGQQAVDLDNLQVDKDALLFSTMMSFEIKAQVHSPVILGKGATQAFLDNPKEYPYLKSILEASRVLEDEYETVIYEGTGHPGVGAVVGLSNAHVASYIDAPVILVVEGGIGYTIDRLFLCLAPFRSRNVRIAGVIVNKVIPEKMDKVRHYIGLHLEKWDIPLLGVLPYDKTLLYPLLGSVKNIIRGRVLNNAQGLNNIVENVVAASLLFNHNFEEEPGVLLVVSRKRLNTALGTLRRIFAEKGYGKEHLAGIILTGDGRDFTEVGDIEHQEFIDKFEFPVISTPLDTYGTAVKISHMEVKINVKTMGKARRAIQLVNEYVDLEKIRW